MRTPKQACLNCHHLFAWISPPAERARTVPVREMTSVAQIHASALQNVMPSSAPVPEFSPVTGEEERAWWRPKPDGKQREPNAVLCVLERGSDSAHCCQRWCRCRSFHGQCAIATQGIEPTRDPDTTPHSGSVIDRAFASSDKLRDGSGPM